MSVFVAAVSVALVVSFLCSIFESVLLSIGHAQVENLTRRGKRSGKLLKAFKRRIDIPIAAILIVNTIAHTVGAAVAGATYQDVFSPQTLWVFTIVFTTAVLLFTEIVPKTLGVTYASALATPVAYGIRALTIALRPLVVLSDRISRAIRGGKEVPVTSVEEIRLLAALGRTEGVLGVRTAGMILGATRLHQLRAMDVMVPRQQVVFLSARHSREQILQTVTGSGHSRFPFSPTDELDDIAGVVLAKELLYRLQRSPSEKIDWSSLAREPLVVPATKPLDRLLRTFQESRRHLAVVVDEYGTVEGIVTLEDVLEEIVGDILDESDHPIPELWPQADGSLNVRAVVELRKVCERLGLERSPATEATSLGGLLTELLDRIPVKGDVVEWNGYRLEVLSASERRAELISIRRAG